jgi:DNA polymerase III delta prime subunit
MSLERTYWRDIVKKQRNMVLNQPLLAGLYDHGLDVSLLFPDLYLDPRIKTYKKVSGAKRLDEWLKPTFQKDRNVLFVGEPGIGKTTAITKMYLDHLDKFLSGQTDIVPLFLKARSHTINLLTNFERLVKAIISDIVPGQQADRLQIEKSEFLFFIDGIDEYSEIPLTWEVSSIVDSDILKHWFVMTARKDFFIKYLSGFSEFNTAIYEIIELQKWEFESEASIFLQRYFQKCPDPEKQTKLILLLDLNLQLRNLLATPLLVTMFLFIWRYGSPDELKIRTINQLYDLFLDKWLEREHLRGTSRIDPENAIEMLKNVALKMYVSRSPTKLEDLLKEVSHYSDSKLRDLSLDTGLGSLFAISERVWRGKRSLYVEKFIHETLMEYLVSELILDSILYGNPNPNYVLQNIFVYEVNEFLRNRFEQMPLSMKNELVDRLIEIYKGNLSANDRRLLDGLMVLKRKTQQNRLRKKAQGGGKSESITEMIVRDQVMYYLGRIQSEKAKEFLSVCYYFERSIWIVRTIAVSSIIQDNLEIEKDYLTRVSSEEKVDSVNRGFCLVYHGDFSRKLGDYEDDNTSSWRKTRNAFFAKLSDATVREQRLRWWRLLTIRRFLETRNEFKTVTSTEREMLEQADKNIESLPKYKQDAIRKEVETLRNLIKH